MISTVAAAAAVVEVSADAAVAESTAAVDADGAAAPKNKERGGCSTSPATVALRLPMVPLL